MKPSLLLQLATTLPLVGIIALIQGVSYPLFAKVGAASFAEYHAGHTRLIGFVVGPLMLGELLGAVWCLAERPNPMPPMLAWLGFVLVLVAAATTALLSVPCHEALARGFDAKIHERLVFTNWIRTFAWTARGLILLWVAWGIGSQRS